MTSDKIKQICKEVFDDYEITNLSIDGDDAVLKIKPKRGKILNDFFKIINGTSNAILDINNRLPT